MENTLEDWIKQKSKEYGGRNAFLSSAEYKAAYPEMQRIWREEKEQHKKNIYKSKMVRVKKEDDGTFSLNFVLNPNHYIASTSGGLLGIFGGKMTFKTELDAVKFAQRHNFPLTANPAADESGENRRMP